MISTVGLARVLSVGVASLFGVAAAFALPFNDDMVDMQPRAGVSMRQKPPGSVPAGALSYRVDSPQAAEALTNPIERSALSAMRGRRLWQVNCSVCHGDITAKDWKAGPVGEKFGMVPDIRAVDPARQKDYRQVSDGYLYSVIHFGSASRVMPGYGWKLSPSEHWEIINFIRDAQSKVQ
jgi:S-disulfanyl-L-cysteine oxidoreductase SoxD